MSIGDVEVRRHLDGGPQFRQSEDIRLRQAGKVWWVVQTSVWACRVGRIVLICPEFTTMAGVLLIRW